MYKKLLLALFKRNMTLFSQSRLQNEAYKVRNHHPARSANSKGGRKKSAAHYEPDGDEEDEDEMEEVEGLIEDEGDDEEEEGILKDYKHL